MRAVAALDNWQMLTFENVQTMHWILDDVDGILEAHFRSFCIRDVNQMLPNWLQ